MLKMEQAMSWKECSEEKLVETKAWRKWDRWQGTDTVDLQLQLENATVTTSAPQRESWHGSTIMCTAHPKE